MKILAVGDIHLGRTPSRLPAELAGRARDFGPGEAWRRTVESALREQVRAVLLAGDVVDRDDDFFEAYGALERGVRQLADAGVEVVGVAGNHDVEVLPKLARELPAFRLLGADGRWEAVEIGMGAGAGGLTVWGWSFPRRQVFDSPLATLPVERGTSLSLGLLHCDRDASGGPYAPVTSGELQAAGMDGWLLGHIHAPDALTADSPSGYLGSLGGLHRGETGMRGPWLIEVEGGRIESLGQVPLAPLRWERIDVDLEGIDEAADAKGRVLAALRAYDSELVGEQARWMGTKGPDAVGAALRLRGRSGFGMAAGESPDRDELVEQTRKRLRDEAQRDRWQGLGEPSEPSSDDAVAWLRKAGWRALDPLLAQSPGENRSAG